MKLKVSMIVSAVAALGQLAVQASSFVPDEYKHYILGVHVITEAALKVIAYFYNPDGTTAKAAYIPQEK